MYVKHSLFKRLSLVMTEEDNDDSSTTILSSSTDPDFSSGSTTEETTQLTSEITTGSTTLSSSTTTEVTTSPGGGGDNEEDEKKWVLPLVISLGCLLLVAGVAAIVIIYRKWKCFGLPLPFTRRKVLLAQPIKKIANSVRSSISSSFSSSAGTLLGGAKGSNKQFKKYAVKVNRKLEGENGNNDRDASERDLDWIEEKDFSAEFEALKRADLKDIPVTAALKPENVMRNRFSNVLPFDKTRVVLTTATGGAGGNDYVNASYVSGYQKEMEFICTQGPLRHTVTDFWRMCWEARAVAIVMLTKCYEKNQEKCFPYWQTGNTGYNVFGDVKITLVKKTTWRLKVSSGQGQDDGSADQLSSKDHLWQVSELELEKDGDEGTHSIIHIVFLSWPDFGIVDPPESLISFIRHVQQLVRDRQVINNNGNLGKEKDRRGPVVVHCSAGVGRSGVFVAVDHLIKQLAGLKMKEDSGSVSVNIFQTVAKMRRERMGMVQNLMQYTLIYKCLRILASRDGLSKEDEQPSIVSDEKIQGSDWGLLYPEVNAS